jgi:hypothetical protein
LRKSQHQKKGGEFVGIAKLTPFGKDVKKRLLDVDHDQIWLIEQVSVKTGLYFDRSYLHKIMTGKLNTPRIVSAICEILGIEKQT